jgi:hypothetical protein
MVCGGCDREKRGNQDEERASLMAEQREDYDGEIDSAGTREACARNVPVVRNTFPTCVTLPPIRVCGQSLKAWNAGPATGITKDQCTERRVMEQGVSDDSATPGKADDQHGNGKKGRSGFPFNGRPAYISTI